MKITDYTYKYDINGYVILFKGKMIDGLSINRSLYSKPLNFMYIEYHRQQAQKKLKKILKWQK